MLELRGNLDCSSPCTVLSSCSTLPLRRLEGGALVVVGTVALMPMLSASSGRVCTAHAFACALSPACASGIRPLRLVQLASFWRKIHSRTPVTSRLQWAQACSTVIRSTCSAAACTHVIELQLWASGRWHASWKSCNILHEALPDGHPDGRYNGCIPACILHDRGCMSDRHTTHLNFFMHVRAFSMQVGHESWVGTTLE